MAEKHDDLAGIRARRANIGTVELIMLLDSEAFPFFRAAPTDIDRLFAVIEEQDKEIAVLNEANTYLKDELREELIEERNRLRAELAAAQAELAKPCYMRMGKTQYRPNLVFPTEYYEPEGGANE